MNNPCLLDYMFILLVNKIMNELWSVNQAAQPTNVSLWAWHTWSGLFDSTEWQERSEEQVADSGDTVCHQLRFRYKSHHRSPLSRLSQEPVLDRCLRVFPARRTDDVLSAMAMISEHTCVSFHRRTSEANYLRFSPSKGYKDVLIFHNCFNKHWFLFSVNLKVYKVLSRNQSQTIRRMHTLQIMSVRVVIDGKRTV